jgi:superfamily II DNA or RNA helicase
MVQSLVRKGRVNEAISQYGHIIVDECHHVPAVSVESILNEAHARFLTGLTATPNRRDGLHPILHMQVGPTRFTIDTRQSVEESIVHRLIIRETGFTVDPGTEDLGIQDLYRAIGSDEARNAMIIDDIIRAVDEGLSPLVLTERKDHLSYLADQLECFVQNLVVLHGGLPAKKRKDLIETLKNIPADQERLVIATGRYIGEGFDDARLDTLFLAMPVSWKGVLIQYTGRLHRSYSGKKEVLIFDYADRGVPMLDRMFEKRLRAYRSIGYEPSEHPPWE